MAKKKAARRKPLLGECPNQSNGGKPYTLWEFVPLLQEKTFAQFFLDLMKRAESNEPAAIACLDSYLAPTTVELQELGIPASQLNANRKCTDSGLLVAVVAKMNA